MRSAVEPRKLKLTSQRDGVDVLLVIGESHELLTETDGVFALGHTVKLLEILLGDAPLWEVHLETENTDVGGSGGDIKLSCDCHYA